MWGNHFNFGNKTHKKNYDVHKTQKKVLKTERIKESKWNNKTTVSLF